MAEDFFLAEPLLAFLDEAGVPFAGAIAVLDSTAAVSVGLSASFISVSSCAGAGSEEGSVSSVVL